MESTQLLTGASVSQKGTPASSELYQDSSHNTVHLISVLVVFCFGQDALDGTHSRHPSGGQPDHGLHQPGCDREVSAFQCLGRLNVLAGGTALMRAAIRG